MVDKDIDIAMFQETNKNLADVENGDAWKGYTVFFSTIVNPKTRDNENKKREDKMVQRTKRQRKTTTP